MGVFNAELNFSAMSAEMSKTSLPWMNGSIQIIDPDLSEQSWNEWTNQYAGTSATVLWSGPARIQHLKNERGPMIGYTDSSIRGIRFQIPIDGYAGFIRKGLQVIVTDGGNDTELEKLQFVVTSAVNSSYAWLRTIEAEVDAKSIADATWSSIAGKVTNNGSPLSGVTVRSFHYQDSLWIMDYETITDTLGNYELPADAGVPVAVVASKSTYVTKYYNNVSGFGAATLITPTNRNETQNINFSLVSI